MGLYSFIWLLYGVQLTFLLASYWLWNDLQKFCYFYFSLALNLLVSLKCCTYDFITQKSLCFLH